MILTTRSLARSRTSLSLDQHPDMPALTVVIDGRHPDSPHSDTTCPPVVERRITTNWLCQSMSAHSSASCSPAVERDGK
jgi:hypothetical protein